jgi:hypothetical protein
MNKPDDCRTITQIISLSTTTQSLHLRSVPVKMQKFPIINYNVQSAG